MKYHVTIGDTTHLVEIDGETVRIDGAECRAVLEALGGTPVQLVTIGREVHRVIAARGDARSVYRISIGGRRFQAEALNERARIIRELAGNSGKAAGPAPLVAPMPGLIVRIMAQPGDQVRAGQGLVIMEAMKMENELRAPTACVVRAIHVTPGNAVEKGTLLVDLE